MKAALVLTLFIASACHHGGRHHHQGAVPAPSSADTGPLTEAAIAIPIRAGQTAAWRAALADLTGPRYDEYEASRRRFGLTEQTTYLQSTPMGDFALIDLAGPDVHAAFHQMAASRDPWDVQWRSMTQDLHGVDFARAAPPTVEPLVATGAPIPGTVPFVFVVPVTPDRIERVRALAAEVGGPRRAAYQAARRRLGVEREAMFLQQSGGAVGLVVAWTAADPAVSLAALAASDDPFDRWLLAAMSEVHPVPLASLVAIISHNALVGQYPHPP